ncbi:RNA polymerase sigma factor [Acuticoccus sediminis]|uniref:RNA polymerase sigma factor n=1 Tax=Acuticoccus sediminis TaxID=2184697 RepID=UPI001CFCF6C1|nr:sigma-70 family RNA polymerase sigma factor [Acuticoccus sediminis]
MAVATLVHLERPRPGQPRADRPRAGRPVEMGARSTEHPPPAAHDPVARLIRAVAGGDVRAFHRLYTTMAPRLERFAARLLDDPVAAEDIAQDTMLEVWNAARRFDGSTRGTAWITTLAHRKIDAARAAGAVPTLPISEELAAPDAIGAGETAAAVRAVVRTLPHEERQAIERCHLEGFTLADAAAASGRSVATVKLRLSRGRDRLRRRLARLRG